MLTHPLCVFWHWQCCGNMWLWPWLWGSWTGLGLDTCSLVKHDWKLDCNRSRDVAIATIFLFFQSTQFFRHSDKCVINSVHSATTRSTVVDHTNTPTTCRGVPLWAHFYFFDPHDWVRVPRDTTRSANAVLNAWKPINWPINNNLPTSRG